MPAELGPLLGETQRLVVASIKQKGADQPAAEELRARLGECVEKLKTFFL
jgi:hypothetical protein